MKLCTDCKHFRNSIAGAEFGKCAAFRSNVDGTPAYYCYEARSSRCGDSAVRFEPKPPSLLARLVDKICK